MNINFIKIYKGLVYILKVGIVLVYSFKPLKVTLVYYLRLKQKLNFFTKFVNVNYNIIIVFSRTK